MGLFNSFNKQITPRQGSFDINLLPMNLSEGRNIGELSGLFLCTAPKKAENSRQGDIFIVLFHIDNMKIPEPQLQKWADILSESYFASRGSFTMGITSSVKRLTTYLAKERSGQIMPVILLNIAVIRDRTLLLAHAGPVNSTVISSDHVQNFCNDDSLPLQISNNDLSFFSADLHSEDLILLCPRVPSDWTNASIMDVTGDSPLNAIRFLLDRSNGNLQAAVIQLKTGKGKITFRTKTNITANVQLEFEDKLDIPETHRRRSSDLIENHGKSGDYSFEETASDKPLYRKRKPAELFDMPDSENKDLPEAENTESDKADPEDESHSLTGDKELPGSSQLHFEFKEEFEKPKKRTISLPPEHESETVIVPTENKNPQKKEKSKPGKFNFSRFALIILCGIMIPLIVVSILFFVYSGRSRNSLHREYLNKAVSTAQTALAAADIREQESLWNEVLSYVDNAMNYGNSTTAKNLRKEAIDRIDQINGGTSTVYNYANKSKLPQGLNITEIMASGQYTYALDASSGSVFRFTASGNGLTLDSNFSCSPGTYKELGKDNSNIQVGAIKDFVILPSGNPHSFVLAGIDADANILYCSAFASNQAGRLIKPATDKFTINSLAFSDNYLYVLDTQASAVWEYLYSGADGFVYDPSNFYGSYSPYLSDIIDFSIYKEYAYFLRANGTLMICDYTGYRPDCRNITDVSNSEGTAQIDMSLHKFSKIMVNNSPDNSIYIMDAKLQTILNLSVKGNYIRYIVPNRTVEDLSQYSLASGFGITGQNRLLWSYKNDLYIGNMP